MRGNGAIAVQAVVTTHGVLSRRLEAGSDEAFLFSLFETVKGPEIARMPVDDGMRAHLLHMQYHAMNHAYRTCYAVDAFWIVTIDDASIGRLIMDVTDDLVHIVYIALLPQWRGRGIGSALMQDVLTNVDALGSRCEATVAFDNMPSLKLWARLGFTKRAQDADIIVEWVPESKRTV